MPATYEPNDSPFSDCLRAFVNEGPGALHQWGAPELDEFASCAYSLRRLYPDDNNLRRFRIAATARVIYAAL